MGILVTYRIRQLVRVLCSASDGASPRVLRATSKLIHIGSAAVPELVNALATARSVEVIETLLGNLLDPTTLALFGAGLAHTNRKVVASIAAVLARSKKYNPHELFALFDTQNVSASDLTYILACHRQNLRPEALLEVLDRIGPAALSPLLDLVDQIVGEAAVPVLLSHLKDRRAVVRCRLAEILSRFNTRETHDAFIRLLDDRDDKVRQAALGALACCPGWGDIETICRLLRDPSITFQSKVIETLVQLDDPTSVPILLGYLQDESPHVRRGAMEVLHHVADGSAYAELRNAQNDADWWVRQRVNETLQRIMPPELVEKILDHTTTGSVEQLADLEDNLSGRESAQSLLAYGSSQEGASLDSQASGREPSGLAAAGGGAGWVLNPSTLTPGAMLTKRYRVIRSIGKGAFGTTILTQDTVLHEDVILKFLNSDVAADREVVQRFIHELRFARRITHENVIRIHDFLTFDSSYAISMEYFPSHTLGDELEQHTPMEIRRSLEVIREVCQGMNAAHQANIVHRDLKPQNILINDDGMVKIVDFGLSTAIRTQDSRLTQTGVFLGTPSYIAPEQIRGEEVDFKVDIYSLGIILYELLTGRVPYSAENAWAVLFQHISGDATPPHELNPAIDPELEAIVRRAMEPIRDQRYESMQAFQADIEAYLARG